MARKAKKGPLPKVGRGGVFFCQGGSYFVICEAWGSVLEGV